MGLTWKPNEGPCFELRYELLRCSFTHPNDSSGHNARIKVAMIDEPKLLRERVTDYCNAAARAVLRITN